MSRRLAIVSNLYPPYVLGGYEILCHQVCRRLATRGWDIRVLTTNHGCPAPDTTPAEIDGIPVDRDLRLFLSFDQPAQIDRRHRYAVTKQNQEAAARWMDDFKPSLIFVWSLLRATVGPVRAALDANIPLAWTFNDANLESYAAASWNRPHRAFQDRFMYFDATLQGIPLIPSTAISEVVRQDLESKLGQPVAAKVIHQGVPVEELPPKASPGSAHTPFRLLYAGQLHSYKGVMDAVYAANTLADRVVLRIAGSGDREFESLLKANAGPSVEFLGKLDRAALVTQYQWADAFIFPSVWREPFGLTHLEAMACGTPVISTGNGGQGEFLVHERNALIVPPERPDAIQAAIARLMDSDELRLDLATEGMRLARNEYSIDRYVDDLSSWLEKAIR